MPLKTVVKVGNISNLGDARYCAGMAVDMLGFVVIEGQPEYMQPELFQEIRGWISGPKIVAEVYGLRSAGEIAGIMESYRPDYFELSENEYRAFGHHIPVPCIVRVSTPKAGDPFTFIPGTKGYLLIDEGDLEARGSLSEGRPLLVKVSSAAKTSDVLQKYAIDGIAVPAPPKDDATAGHRELSEILELLDES